MSCFCHDTRRSALLCHGFVLLGFTITGKNWYLGNPERHSPFLFVYTGSGVCHSITPFLDCRRDIVPIEQKVCTNGVLFYEKIDHCLMLGLPCLALLHYSRRLDLSNNCFRGSVHVLVLAVKFLRGQMRLHSRGAARTPSILPGRLEHASQGKRQSQYAD